MCGGWHPSVPLYQRCRDPCLYPESHCPASQHCVQPHLVVLPGSAIGCMMRGTHSGADCKSPLVTQVKEEGWLPQHVLVRDADTAELLGAVPLYLKSHSYGGAFLLVLMKSIASARASMSAMVHIGPADRNKSNSC